MIKKLSFLFSLLQVQRFDMKFKTVITKNKSISTFLGSSSTSALLLTMIAIATFMLVGV
jgi:hypothetical protein